MAVVALVAAAAFAFTKIGGSSSKGGAGSSTEAGEQFVTALNNEDILGVVDMLLPGERDTFRQPMLDAVDNFKRLGILSSDADPNKIGGLDIQFDDVKVTAERPVADDIDTIRIRATDNTSYDGSKLPIGDVLLREAFNGDQPTATGSTDGEPVDLKVTTVEKDGRWFISLFYTAAESARGDGDKVPSTPVALAGADKPEDAVDQMLQAASKLDLERIIAGLNPNEAEALQRYAPLFLGNAQRELDQQKTSIKISNAEYRVEGSGNHRNVGITALDVTARSGSENVAFSLADGCITVKAGSRNDSGKFCANDVNTALDDPALADNKDLKALLESLTKAFSDTKGLGIAVDQVDGKWFVSPLGTGGDTFNALLKALDKDELTDIIDKAKAFTSSVDDGGFALPDIGGVLNG